jgi:hypothetical protein
MPQYFHCVLLCPLLYFFYPILSISQMMDPDKAKLFARGGRKAADLTKTKMAELPKDEPLVCSAFLFRRKDAGVLNTNSVKDVLNFII